MLWAVAAVVASPQAVAEWGCCGPDEVVVDAAAKVWIEGRIGGGYVVLRSTPVGAYPQPDAWLL